MARPTTKKKTAVSSEAMQLALEKLGSSGLDQSDIQKLRLEILDATQTAKLEPTFKALPSIKITYWDPFDPTKELRAWTGWNEFYRIRYLSIGTDFGSLTDKKPMRYTNAPRAGVCAYFPPNLPNWPEILENPNEPLIITEGEFKAAKACKEGHATIGLGGVYNYKSTKLGMTFLDELKRINWVQRRVYIIYDSDFRSNEMVCDALNALAEELKNRGAIPYIVPLPDVVEDGGKTGLDDFIVNSPPGSLEQLIVDRRQIITLTQSLWALNKEIVYIHNPGLILVTETGQKLAPSAFKDHAYSTVDHSEMVVNKDGTTSLRPASAGASWLKWQLRREAGSLTYKPGEEQLIRQETGSIKLSKWNTWEGWGVEPKKGDVKPFLDLVDHIFTGAEPEAKDWFLKWCAYPLQHPGVKMYSSAVIYGIKHGTGKSLIGYTLGQIYGKNFTEISQADLHGSFNEWAENKQFVMGDDVTGSNKRQDNDLLKKLITQHELRVNGKYVPTYTVPDCINYFFTSNQPDAFFLEDDDRRFFIHEVTVLPMKESVYQAYDKWRKKDGGASAVMQYLLDYDTKGFNPHGPAFKTHAKERMIADVKSDLGSWVARLVADPDAMLTLGEAKVFGDLFTNRHLLALYDPTGRTGTTANGLGRELRRAGVPQVNHGKPVRTAEGVDRYYVARNAKKWEKATNAEILAHLSKMGVKAPSKREEKY